MRVSRLHALTSACLIAASAAGIPSVHAAEGPVINFPGMSLGGSLRSGPGMEFSKDGSLQENTPVTIIRNTGTSMNGYDWFEIRTGSRTTYQWGGIMCSQGAQLPGIFEQCGARAAAPAPQAPTQAQGQINVPAFSFGGKLRAGPGQSYRQVGSLQERERVIILSNSGVRDGDWDWMEVRAGAKTGYMWGGLLCPDQQMVPGIFHSCGN